MNKPLFAFTLLAVGGVGLSVLTYCTAEKRYSHQDSYLTQFSKFIGRGGEEEDSSNCDLKLLEQKLVSGSFLGLSDRRSIYLLKNSKVCDYVLKKNGVLDESYIGFDTEWRPNKISDNGKAGKTAVIQIATHDSIYVIQLLNCLTDQSDSNNDDSDRICNIEEEIDLTKFPQTLIKLLSSRSCLKVGVGIDHDMKKLIQDYSKIFENSDIQSFIDIRNFANANEKEDKPFNEGQDYTVRNVDGNNNNQSLSSLVFSFLNVELAKDKSITVSDWQRKMLTSEQTRYAALDAHASHSVFSKMIILALVTTERAKKLAAVNVIDTFNKTKGKTNLMDPEERRELLLKQKLDEEKKKERQEKRMKQYSLKRHLYDNIELQAPDGEPLSMIPKKKMEWYLAKGLAERVAAINQEEAQDAIRLKFEPSGRARPDLVVKKNNCVVCGEINVLFRHYVVPHSIRKYFPFQYRTSNDVILLCSTCNVIANTAVQEIRKEIAIELLGPIEGVKALSNCKEEFIAEKKKGQRHARTLLTKRNVLPQDRVNELEEELKDIFPDVEKFNDDILNSIANEKVTREKENWKPIEELIVINLLKDFHGDKSPEIDLKQHDVLVQFIMRWRLHFINILEPQFLSPNWIDQDLDFKFLTRKDKKGEKRRGKEQTS